MATVNPAIQVIKGDPLFTWEGVATGDTFVSIELHDKQGIAVAVQVTGTFGGATAALQVSNDNTNWFTVTDIFNQSVEFTSPGIVEVATSARYVRPFVSGGTSDDIDYKLMVRGN